MIKVQPKNYPNDGCHFSFVCETQEEADFLQGNQDAILDKFVQGNFHNIGHLNIQTYKHYCDRIHAQERAEYLHLKNSPDENEVVPSVEQGLDGFPTVVYFSVARHYLGNRKCTRTYRPSHLDKNAIAEIGEEAFRKLVSKYDGKETQDL